jgi:hypothetical protein
MIKACLTVLAILLVVASAFFGQADQKQLDEGSLRSYMTGEYDLIGRKADSTTTYNGHVTFRDEAGALQVIRTVDGKTEKCAARFDTVAAVTVSRC